MNILFMCVANSARSQLAEGLARTVFPDAEIRSAGSHPKTLHPDAVAVMKEMGIDISAHYSKALNEIEPGFLLELDYIITLCAEEVCPAVMSRAKKLHWPFLDPASKDAISKEDTLRRFREARNEIHARLKSFKRELGQ